MEPFKAKLGPLPIWAWGGIITAGAVAFFWWRGRAAGGAAATDPNAAGGNDAGAIASQLGALGYYDGSGVQTGTGGSTSGGGGGASSGGGGGTKTDPRNCATVKDPSGKSRHICGFGHWYRKAKGGHWYWTPGPIPTNGLHAAWQYRSGPVGHGGHPAAPRSGIGTGTQQAHVVSSATTQAMLAEAAAA